MFTLLLASFIVGGTLGTTPEKKPHCDAQSLIKREIVFSDSKSQTKTNNRTMDQCVQWGFSIFDKIVAAFLKPKSNEALKIVTKLHNCSATIEERFDKQLDYFELHRTSGHNAFNQMNAKFINALFVPNAAVTEYMIRLQKYNITDDPTSIIAFFDIYSGNMDVAMTYMQDSSKRYFSFLFTATHYNETVFLTMRNKFAAVFLEIIAARSFSYGVYSQPSNETHILEMLQEETTKDRQKFARLMAEITQSFYNTTRGALKTSDLEITYKPVAEDVDSFNLTLEASAEMKNQTMDSCIEWVSSSLDEIAAAFIQMGSDNSSLIINETINCLEDLLKQLSTELSNLNMFYGDRRFEDINYRVFTSVKAIAEKMIFIVRRGDIHDKGVLLDYLRAHRGASMDMMIETIIFSAGLFTYTSNATNYNETVFLSTKKALKIAFLETLVMQSFRFWADFGQEALNLLDYALSDRERFEKMINEATDDFYANFFPGTIQENIIKKIVDSHTESSNCAICHAITHQLRINYPWRQFGVIVTDDITSDKYAVVGIPGNFLAVTYKSKKVFVFLASEKFQENFKLYHDQDATKIQSISLESSRDLKRLTEPVEKGKIYQTIVIKTSFDQTCFHSTHSNTTDAFSRTFKFRTGSLFSAFERIVVFHAVIF